MKDDDYRLTFRVERADDTAIRTLAASLLTRPGKAFVSRSEVIRHALQVAAAEAARNTPGAPRVAA